MTLIATLADVVAEAWSRLGVALTPPPAPRDEEERDIASALDDEERQLRVLMSHWI